MGTEVATAIECGICGEPFRAGPYIGGVALGGLCTNAHRVWVSDLKAELEHSPARLTLINGYLALALAMATEARQAS